MYRGKTISVVIPCYNEEDGIRHVIEAMPPLVDEIVVVDNNSTDKTGEVARSLGARVIHETRKGYGAAYQAGLPAATKDIIVTLDGDGSYPPNEIPRILDFLIDKNIDFISASRFPLKTGGSMNFMNMVGNKVLTAAMFLLYFRKIDDSQSGMWVFRREVYAQLRATHPGMAFSEEIKIEAILAKGVRFAEFPIDYKERIGEVKLNMWHDGFDNLFFLVRKRFASRAAR